MICHPNPAEFCSKGPVCIIGKKLIYFTILCDYFFEPMILGKVRSEGGIIKGVIAL
jgi:hypothetical protein